MNVQLDVPPDAPQRAAEVLEFLAKLAGALAIVWGFIAKVAKPFVDWRRRRLQEAIRDALRADLDPLRELPSRVELALERQDQVFDEIDLFLEVIADNRDRINEINGFLDEVGFASRDRRHAERRRTADEAFDELQGRLRSRRRRDDDIKRAD